FYVKSAATHLPLVIDVLSDMILTPLLKAEEIEKEKGVIIEEINMYEDMPMRHVGDVYEELMYGDTPLGWDTAGKPEIIRSINRQDFVDYMNAWYRPNNAVIVIAGQVESSKFNIQDLVEKSLSGWKNNPIQQFKTQSDKQEKPALKVKYKQTEQAHLCLGVRAYSMKHPKKYPLSVLSAILGGGMSSRLFIEVREKRGLAYYVKSDATQYLDVGNFVTQSGVDVKRIDDAISVIIDQYMGIASGKLPVKAEELTKAKEHLKGHLTLELEDSRSVAAFYGTQEILRRKIRTLDEVMAKTDAVTLNEVHEVAKEIFVPKHLNLAVIGPYKDENRFKKLLK
ncbi:MAG: pitrilysin family protein, partial [Patescibacteria group bacterium]